MIYILSVKFCNKKKYKGYDGLICTKFLAKPCLEYFLNFKMATQ